MAFRVIWAPLVVLLSCGAVEARAQSTERWDAAVTTGIFLGHPSEISLPTTSYHDRWYRTGQLAASVGRYLTPHLKAESELALMGEGRRYVTQHVQVPGAGPFAVGSEHLVRARSVAGTLAWQFLDNQWVHPFVLAGAAVDFERTRVETWQQSFYRGDPRNPGNQIVVSENATVDLGTGHRVRGIVGAGAKSYITPRAFFRSDARVGVGGTRSGHVSFRLGFGVDF